MSKNDPNPPETQPTPTPETRHNPVSVLSTVVSDASHNPHLLRYLRESANLTQTALARGTFFQRLFKETACPDFFRN